MIWANLLRNINKVKEIAPVAIAAIGLIVVLNVGIWLFFVMMKGGFHLIEIMPDRLQTKGRAPDPEPAQEAL
jgi:hypothetical protein